MKNKEEPSTNSLRGNHSSTEETTGSLSRPGLTAAARAEQPALSSLMDASRDAANVVAAFLTRLAVAAYHLRRTA